MKFLMLTSLNVLRKHAKSYSIFQLWCRIILIKSNYDPEIAWRKNLFVIKLSASSPDLSKQEDNNDDDFNDIIHNGKWTMLKFY
jgi:hypothetical protein